MVKRLSAVALTLAGAMIVQEVAAQSAPPSTVEGAFSFIAAGDILQQRPFSQRKDIDIQDILRPVKAADIAVANLEGFIEEPNTFIGDYLYAYTAPIWATAGSKDVAADLQNIGFDLLNRANNWTTRDSLIPTNIALEAAAIASAGVGRNLQEARAVRFVETPKGRIGMIGMVAIGYQPATTANAAAYQIGDVPGKPGTNPLRLKTYTVVSAEHLAELRRLRTAMYAHAKNFPNPAAPPVDAGDRNIDFFGQQFIAGDTPGLFHYEMNADDLRDILRSIRNGKQYGDFIVANLHAHEPYAALVKATNVLNPTLDFPPEVPPDFVVELAHKAIDAGADIFVVNGVHALRGVEIYKDKPIFYGLGDFVFQVSSIRQPDMEAIAPATDQTPTERARAVWAGTFQPRYFEAILAESHFENGKLREVRLLPVDLGFNKPGAQRGIPRKSSLERAREILERVRARSQSFGTKIDVQRDIGVIRVE